MSYGDRQKRHSAEFKREFDKSSRLKEIGKELEETMHGRVRHICISCQGKEIFPCNPRNKVCAACSEDIPWRDCLRCKEQFKEPTHRSVCVVCRDEIKAFKRRTDIYESEEII